MTVSDYLDHFFGSFSAAGSRILAVIAINTYFSPIKVIHEVLHGKIYSDFLLVIKFQSFSQYVENLMWISHLEVLPIGKYK